MLTNSNTALRPPRFLQPNALRYDPFGGTLRTTQGQRAVAFPSELIVGLHKALERETGRAMPLVTYTCGRHWGERLMQRWQREWSEEYGVTLAELDSGRAEQWLVHTFRSHGWGDLQLDYTYERHGVLLWHVRNSVFVELLPDLDEPRVCAIFAGLLAAVTSAFAGTALECVEFGCAKAGHGHCSFAVSDPSRIERGQDAAFERRAPNEVLAAVLNTGAAP